MGMNIMPVTCMTYRVIETRDKKRLPLYPQAYQALYTYTAEDETQLSLVPGQKVVPILKDSSEEWWFVKADSGKKGYVPASYLTPLLD